MLEACSLDDRGCELVEICVQWPEHLDMLVPCSIVGEQGTKLEATISVACGTLGVGPLEIRSLSWFAVSASSTCYLRLATC